MESAKASIVVLKTGTQIICDLKEVFDGEGDNRKGVCLLMVQPYELSLVNQNNETQDLQVRFSKWCPYSSDYQFKIPYDSVLAIGVADVNLEQAYRVKIQQVTELDNNTNPEILEEFEEVPQTENA